MPKGIKKLSEEWKQNIGKANKGKLRSEEDKLKMSEARKGEHSSLNTEFKKGNLPWNTGKKRPPFSEEWKKKISKHLIGNKYSLGIYPSEETKQKISNGMKGKNTWTKGVPRSQKAKEAVSRGMKKLISGGYTLPITYLKGENSPNWKGGITSLNNVIRNNFIYRQWISDIFHRDDFTCQECGVRGGDLNAHHIKSFSSIIQFYEITTLEEALDCAELWNINNGVTLCIKCHKKIYRRVLINA